LPRSTKFIHSHVPESPELNKKVDRVTLTTHFRAIYLSFASGTPDLPLVKFGHDRSAE